MCHRQSGDGEGIGIVIACAALPRGTKEASPACLEPERINEEAHELRGGSHTHYCKENPGLSFKLMHGLPNNKDSDHRRP